MERHCCFLLTTCPGYKCEPGCAECIWALCPSHVFSCAWPEGWDSPEMLSWQRELMGTLLLWSAGERNPNLFHSGRSPHFELLLNKCGHDSVKYVQNYWMEALWLPEVLPEDAAAWEESFPVWSCSLLGPCREPHWAEQEHPKGSEQGWELGKVAPPQSTWACPGECSAAALAPAAPLWAWLGFGIVQLPVKWWQRSDLSWLVQWMC